jgi:hypothetical protein
MFIIQGNAGDKCIFTQAWPGGLHLSFSVGDYNPVPCPDVELFLCQRQTTGNNRQRESLLDQAMGVKYLDSLIACHVQNSGRLYSQCACLG